MADPLRPWDTSSGTDDSQLTSLRATDFSAQRPISLRARAGTKSYTVETELAKNKVNGKPAIINVNIGTTVKGAVDNLDRILRTLTSLGYKREEYYIHCDGALFAMMLPFLQWAPEVSFEKPIDSIAVSGHKVSNTT